MACSKWISSVVKRPLQHVLRPQCVCTLAKMQDVRNQFWKLNAFQKSHPFSTASSPADKNFEIDSQVYYSSEENKKILKTVNDIEDLENLQKFGFPRKAIKELHLKRRLGQKVESLEDLISLLGIRSSSRSFALILGRPTSSISQPISPVPTTQQVQETDSAVSIILTGYQVSWCRIKRNRDNTLEIQDLHQNAFMFKPKTHFLTLLDEVIDLSNSLPKSDTYIVEEYPSSPPNPIMIGYHLHMTQLKSFLLGTIIARSDSPRIIAVKTVAVAKIFKTIIGSERVSGQQLVDKMIIWKPLTTLTASAEVKNKYENTEATGKEGLANSILLNLAYWKLTKQFTEWHR